MPVPKTGHGYVEKLAIPPMRSVATHGTSRGPPSLLLVAFSFFRNVIARNDQFKNLLLVPPLRLPPSFVPRYATLCFLLHFLSPSLSLPPSLFHSLRSSSYILAHSLPGLDRTWYEYCSLVRVLQLATRRFVLFFLPAACCGRISLCFLLLLLLLLLLLRLLLLLLRTV